MNWLQIWTDYKRVILTTIALIVLLLLMAWMFQSCSESKFRREINDIKTNANLMANQAGAVHANLREVQERVNANLANLEQQSFEQEIYVNALVNSLNVSKTAREQAQRETNAVLENVSRVENGNYANSNLSEAEKARCRAFPERCR